jgi:hypothetical protein
MRTRGLFEHRNRFSLAGRREGGDLAGLFYYIGVVMSENLDFSNISPIYVKESEVF